MKNFTKYRFFIYITLNAARVGGRGEAEPWVRIHPIVSSFRTELTRLFFLSFEPDRSSTMPWSDPILPHTVPFLHTPLVGISFSFYNLHDSVSLSLSGIVMNHHTFCPLPFPDIFPPGLRSHSVVRSDWENMGIISHHRSIPVQWLSHTIAEDLYSMKGVNPPSRSHSASPTKPPFIVMIDKLITYTYSVHIIRIVQLYIDRTTEYGSV